MAFQIILTIRNLEIVWNTLNIRNIIPPKIIAWKQ